MTAQAETAKRTAVIFASTFVEAEAVLRQLKTVELEYPFRVGLYGDWRVAVMSLMDCDEDTGLVEEALTSSVSSSIFASVTTSVMTTTSVSERGAVSVTRLLEMAQNAFAPEVIVFVGTAISLKKQVVPGAVVAAAPFVADKSKRTLLSDKAESTISGLLLGFPRLTFGAVASSQEAATRTCVARDMFGPVLRGFPNAPLGTRFPLLRGICAADGSGREAAAKSAAEVALGFIEASASDPMPMLDRFLRNLAPQELERISRMALEHILAAEFHTDSDGLYAADLFGGRVILETLGGARDFRLLDRLFERATSVRGARLMVAVSVDKPPRSATRISDPAIPLVFLNMAAPRKPLETDIPTLAAALVAARATISRTFPGLANVLQRLSEHPFMPRAIKALNRSLGADLAFDLAELRSHLLDLTPSDFERAAAAALSGILGIPFRQASSGRQPGGDAGGGTVRLEAKRYRDNIPTSRELLGGLATICQAVPGLSHWVVASTAGFPLQAADELRADAENRLIREVILDWPAAGIPPLAGVLVAGREEVGRLFPDLAPILAHLAENPDVVKAGEDVRAALRTEPPGRPIYDPVLRYNARTVAAAAALDPRYRLVPFMNRERELEEWIHWANHGNESAFLLTGAGGMGKTRLLIEVCRDLKALGWRAGFLWLGFDLTELHRQLSGRDQVLVVIDYAERREEDVTRLCRLIVETRAFDRIKVALLARTAGTWVDQLADDLSTCAILGEGALKIRSLEPAAPRKADHARRDRWQVLEEAVRAFAFHHKEKSGAEIMAALRGRLDIDRDEYDVMLDLLAEARLELFDGKTSGDAVDDGLVRWERRYLKGLAPKPLTADTMMKVLAWIFSHDGAATEQEAIALLARCPALAGASAPLIANVAEAFHKCYGGEKWLNKVQPDRVGEAVLRKYPC